MVLGKTDIPDKNKTLISSLGFFFWKKESKFSYQLSLQNCKICKHLSFRTPES